jgi:hypothetical protein
MSMTAGRYYIGDLCYVMSDEEWDEVCSITIKDNKCIEGEFNLKDGRRFALYGTAWGDGLYNDQYGHSYAVDSGTIGCILESDIKENIDDILQLGALIDMNTPFVTSGGRGDPDWEGIIQFGTVMIETSPVEYMDDI